MTDHALASFEAKDGTGRWEVFTWGIIANGQRYHFTKQSHIVCAGLPGRTEKHVYQTEEDDGFGLWAALAVYQETGTTMFNAMSSFTVKTCLLYTSDAADEL